ncbi:MAG: cellulase family glycosylhydrolase [Leadbetterella sp.]
MKKLIAFAFFCSFWGNTFSQSTIFEINKKLGKGINMGNMLEAPTETAWSNPFRDEYFKIIAEQGLNHVRIPIRWDTPERSDQMAPYKLKSEFLSRVKYVVDLALKENLYVIINMHHHETMFTDPVANSPKFLAQWEQIAAYFKGYNDRLIFEVLNEPHDKLTPAVWNPLFKQALAIIRKENPTRAVLIAPTNYNGLSGVPFMDIPNDPNLIISIHYYDPFQFTHQGAEWISGDSKKWLGTKWENTRQERNEVKQAFKNLITVAKTKNLPINIGEFGAYSTADIDSRTKWTNFLARWFEEQGFSWAYWEFSAGFGIYNPSSKTILKPLANALINDKMYPEVIIQTNLVYESKFVSNSDNWVLNINNTSAKGNLAVGSNEIKLNITQSGSEEWHAQLVKSNIRLEKGKRYFVTLELDSDKPISFSHYIGKSSGDYTAYSGYRGMVVDKQTSLGYSFIMNSPTDEAARIVFDLGKITSPLIIKSFIIEVEKEILLSTQSESSEITIFPNPSGDSITIYTQSHVLELEAFDMKGTRISQVQFRKEQSPTLSVSNWKAGKYILLISTEKGKVKQRFIKN